MSTTTQNVIIPSSPNDRQQIKLKIVEITNSFSKIDAEKDHIKEILSDAEAKFGIKKKLISKMARTMYKHSYDTLQQENEDFSTLYETLVEGKKDAESEAD
jgi:hypothetical protein